MVLTRDAILNRPVQLPRETLHIPEWGGSVIVQGLTGAQRDSLEGKMTVIRGNKREINSRNFRARLAQMTIVDDNGTRLFEETDIDRLGREPSVVLSRIFDVAARLSGITEADAEEIEGNFETDQNDDSISDSPSL